ncbi:MAG: hypothetical protein NT023_09695 [Armatimonadetes bacterium]|nr:hypothetical protein [Armatimonadota bacterium]
MSYSVQSKKTGTTYFLHGRETESRGGKRLLYFFSKEVKDGALEALPEGFVVTESEKTGLPLLKRA